MVTASEGVSDEDFYVKQQSALAKRPMHFALGVRLSAEERLTRSSRTERAQIACRDAFRRWVVVFSVACSLTEACA